MPTVVSIAFLRLSRLDRPPCCARRARRLRRFGMRTGSMTQQDSPVSAAGNRAGGRVAALSKTLGSTAISTSQGTTRRASRSHQRQARRPGGPRDSDRGSPRVWRAMSTTDLCAVDRLQHDSGPTNSWRVSVCRRVSQGRMEGRRSQGRRAATATTMTTSCSRSRRHRQRYRYLQKVGTQHGQRQLVKMGRLAGRFSRRPTLRVTTGEKGIASMRRPRGAAEQKVEVRGVADTSTPSPIDLPGVSGARGHTACRLCNSAGPIQPDAATHRGRGAGWPDPVRGGVCFQASGWRPKLPNSDSIALGGLRSGCCCFPQSGWAWLRV